MNDKEYNKQRARVRALEKKWITPLGLRWWKVKFVYSRDTVDDRDDGRTCVAQTMVDWQYLQATITFDMQAVQGEADNDLEREFVHECCHILVNEMRMWATKEMDKDKHDEGINHEERVVTQLASAFLWTYEAGRDGGLKRANRKKVLKRK